MPVHKWSTTAASNGTADATINWQEGQAPSSVNDSSRAEMAAVAKWRDDNTGTLTTGGSSTALTLTTNSVFASLADMSGHTVAFTPHATSGAAPTLNVDGLGAKALKSVSGTALVTGALLIGGVYRATYSNSNSEWVVHGIFGGAVLQDGEILLPPGSMIPYAGASAPGGWLLCYGQAVSRTTYAALFAAISTTYGAGDASTTFNLPDLRGRVVAGQDDMGGSSANRLTNVSGGLDGDTLGAVGGSESHVLTQAQLPNVNLTAASDGAHTHGVTIGAVQTDAATGGGITVADDEQGAPNWSATSDSGGAHTHTVSLGGSGTAHNNVQPTLILNYIIKT